MRTRLEKQAPPARKCRLTIALAGNPNVGKSTVFNALTGMKQHTGNWAGKTVENARGVCTLENTEITLTDIPGTYSLLAHSREEEVARDYICFGGCDAVIVVCDATCLERNLNLVLQTVEISRRVVVCVNLMDEARRKGIRCDLDRLSQELGVPVIGACARSKKGLHELQKAVIDLCSRPADPPLTLDYGPAVSARCAALEHELNKLSLKGLPVRWLALRLLEGNPSFLESLSQYLGFRPETVPEIALLLSEEDRDRFCDGIVTALYQKAKALADSCISYSDSAYNERDRRIDRILTSKRTGIPVMLLLLGLVFLITISLSNIPSALLAKGFAFLQAQLSALFTAAGAPAWLHSVCVDGIFQVLGWVISVMLPPMAIFFPLFTLLEDFGYLPRVAFNLDNYFKKAHACGKQVLTMCMGLGCNSVGVTGCRIIDSPRERLIAILTNNFMPCNGRFPTLLTIIGLFFAAQGFLGSLTSALILLLVIVFGVAVTLLMSRLLSATMLKGLPSSFTLELPPYRRPQFGTVITRSLLDRTLFVLGRAAAVAAPAGLIIWLCANVQIGDASILSHCTGFLDPFARLLGLDGVILMAFILGFPANEIVLPIILMAYLSSGTLVDVENVSALKEILTANGWTWVTALCTMLFSLLHWPCSTTWLTIRKETKSAKWTAAAMLIPTATAVIVCFIVSQFLNLFV